MTGGRTKNNLHPHLATLPVVRAQAERTDESEDVKTTASSGTDASVPGARVPREPVLTERQRKLLSAIDADPLQPSSTYPKRAGMSSKTAVTVRGELVAMGLVVERCEERAGRGRASLLLELTVKGREALNAEGGGA